MSRRQQRRAAHFARREKPTLNDSLVRLDAVSKVYRMGEVDVHALRAVSLNIQKGELVAIMGASGSGKSTTLNVIGTLDRPSSGSYYLEQQAVEKLTEEELARLRNDKIGFVFQAFHLLPRESAQSNVELPLVYAGVRTAERRRRALEALARVGLADRARHLPHQLSGGQQQRVSLARAIVHDPRLLLADEPTGALDSTTSQQVLELLEGLHRQGMTIVIVTHDPSVAAHAKRVITFSDGQVGSDVSAHATPVAPASAQAGVS
jgi:putative ABC transport system ATP-binding protein